MKKTLIAVAAVLATSAYAQSSVEVYGLIDLSVKSTKTTDAVSNTVTKASSTASQGEDSASRLGFRGTEDLGGGLKASFVIESALNANIGSRPTNLTLSSNTGSVTFGTYFNTFDDILTGDGKGDTIVALVSRTSGTSTNGISFKSAEISGFTFGLGFSKNERKVNGVKNLNDGTTELSVAYSDGPLSVTAAMGKGKSFDKEVAAGGLIGDASDPKLSSTAFKVAYDFGVAVPYVIYARETEKTGAITGGFVAQSSKEQNNGFEIGASFPMGAFTPYVTIARAKSKLFVNGVQVGEQAKRSGHQVGLNYDLSKRTKVYAVVGSSKSKEAGALTDKTRQTSVGLLHAF